MQKDQEAQSHQNSEDQTSEDDYDSLSDQNSEYQNSPFRYTSSEEHSFTNEINNEKYCQSVVIHLKKLSLNDFFKNYSDMNEDGKLSSNGEYLLYWLYQTSRQSYMTQLELKKQKRRLSKLFEKGIKNQEDQNYKQAIKYYQRVEKLDKKNPQLYKRMVFTSFKLNNARKVLEWFHMLDRLDPALARNQKLREIYKMSMINNYGFRMRDMPHIPNPRRVGRNTSNRQPIYSSKSLDKIKDLKRNQHLEQFSKSKSEHAKKPIQYTKNQSKNHIAANRRNVEKLKSMPPQKIQNPLQYPYSAVGVIISQFRIGGKQMTQMGTGCLIGTNIVLTAAHNLYEAIKKVQSTHIVYIPDPKYQKEATYRARKIFVPLQYKAQRKSSLFHGQNQAQLYDYALIQLDTKQDLQGKYGSLSYDFNWQQTAEYLRRLSESKFIENLKTLGFPANQQKQYELTEFQGQALVDINYLIYKQPTTKGVSGGPNIEFIDGQYFVRAVHNKDVKNQTKVFDSKAGLQLRSNMYKSLEQNFTYPVNSYDLNDIDSVPSVQENHQDLGQLINYFTNQADIVQTLIKEIQEKEKQSHQKAIHKIQIKLSCRNIGPRECKKIASADQWLNLHTLQLRYNNIGDEGCSHLASAHKWTKLKQLNLDSNNIGAEGCRHLASPHQWTNLLTLNLRYNNIGAEGCRHLVSAHQWLNLQTLDLYSNKIGDEGCIYITTAHQWANLQTINLQYNNNISECSRSFFHNSKTKIDF